MELTAADEAHSGASREFEVELPRARVEGLALAEGMAVRILPSRIRVFEKAAEDAASDYSI